MVIITIKIIKPRMSKKNKKRKRSIRNIRFIPQNKGDSKLFLSKKLFLNMKKITRLLGAPLPGKLLLKKD
jgi:hypothetical protein